MRRLASPVARQDEPVILNNRLADEDGTVEFLGRDPELTNDPLALRVAVENLATGTWQTPQMCLVQPAFADFD